MNKKRFVDNDSFTSTYRRRASVPEKFAPNEIPNINISSKKVRTKTLSTSPLNTYSRMQFSNEYYNQLEEQSIFDPNESINQNFVKFSNDDDEIQEKSDQENNKESDYNESELDSEEECEEINFDLLETEENSTELSIKNYTYEYNWIILWILQF
ncbi:hypothetical protein Glove_468g10 [Diversispora epigaea]|uniref:Uncharacterized protein n=1 Tax=Diversispora epigaea TaxID=1348612 RepID=A0A397GQU8_9GLOM|nr:hypothetical protein Glove_468g10 [Diversispora epigaea]